MACVKPKVYDRGGEPSHLHHNWQPTSPAFPLTLTVNTIKTTDYVAAHREGGRSDCHEHIILPMSNGEWVWSFLVLWDSADGVWRVGGDGAASGSSTLFTFGGDHAWYWRPRGGWSSLRGETSILCICQGTDWNPVQFWTLPVQIGIFLSFCGFQSVPGQFEILCSLHGEEASFPWLTV